MGFIKKELFIGVSISLVVLCFSIFLYVSYISDVSFIESIKLLKKGKILPIVLALASIPNLIVFFIFLRKNQEYRARGVLITTVFTALAIMILKFI